MKNNLRNIKMEYTLCDNLIKENIHVKFNDFYKLFHKEFHTDNKFLLSMKSKEIKNNTYTIPISKLKHFINIEKYKKLKLVKNTDYIKVRGKSLIKPSKFISLVYKLSNKYKKILKHHDHIHSIYKFYTQLLKYQNKKNNEIINEIEFITSLVENFENE
jgi:hypothetical protein